MDNKQGEKPGNPWMSGYRARLEAKGLRQVAVYVPVEKVLELQSLARQWREEAEKSEEKQQTPA
ncbi:MAG: hypothetical protein HQL56_18440 [Magnetococcales bacterium]|nr:hypothetical protein [Magnetococcales bacterium]